jgi:hypothetical protein
MMMLAMWTVYDHPSDYPDKFVARRFDIDSVGATRASGSIIVAPDLERLRDILAFEMHLTCLVRDPSDDPAIVETWL